MNLQPQTIHLTCHGCYLMDIVLLENARNWKCPWCYRPRITSKGQPDKRCGENNWYRKTQNKIELKSNNA